MPWCLMYVYITDFFVLFNRGKWRENTPNDIVLNIIVLFII